MVIVATFSRYCAATPECYIAATFYSWQWVNWPYFLGLSCKCLELSKVARSNILKVYDITQLGTEPTTSCTPGEHSIIGQPGAVTTLLVLNYWKYESIFHENFQGRGIGWGQVYMILCKIAELCSSRVTQYLSFKITQQMHQKWRGAQIYAKWGCQHLHR